MGGGNEKIKAISGTHWPPKGMKNYAPWNLTHIKPCSKEPLHHGVVMMVILYSMWQIAAECAGEKKAETFTDLLTYLLNKPFLDKIFPALYTAFSEFCSSTFLNILKQKTMLI